MVPSFCVPIQSTVPTIQVLRFCSMSRMSSTIFCGVLPVTSSSHILPAWNWTASPRHTSIISAWRFS